MAGDFLNEMGIKVPDLFAGLAGGAIRTLWGPVFKPLTTVFSAVTGAFTANYLTDTFAAGFDKLFLSWVGAPMNHGAAGFVIGLTAMTLCQAIIEKVRRWSGGKDAA